VALASYFAHKEFLAYANSLTFPESSFKTPTALMRVLMQLCPSVHAQFDCKTDSSVNSFVQWLYSFATLEYRLEEFESDSERRFCQALASISHPAQG
jgi:hypothetical protein